ncbi:MAG: EAL domain-containing protein [Candidatus Competibacter sp.]|nr:EAL domain-containing protein [Candidatus Competibacter sp.]
MPGIVAGLASRLVAKLAVLALLGVWVATYACAAGESPAATDSGPGWFHSFRFGTLAGIGLMLLGLAGGALVVLLEQRRRLWSERSRYHEHLDALNKKQRELEAEIERQRAGAQALRDSEQRFRNLAQHLPAGIFLMDTGAECRYVNDRWCRLSGLTAEQAIGSGWIQAFHLDDRDQVLQFWRQSVGQGTGFVADLRFRNPSGRVTWLNICAEPVRDRAGQITGYLGAVIDIAERKRTEETLRASEARFRSFFESSPVGLCLTGPDKRWLEVNDRLCEMLGYRREQLLGLSWAELTHSDDIPTDVAHFERAMSHRIDGYSLDKRFVRQDGGLLHVNVSTRCVRRASGPVDYFVTVVQDITERKQAEERILNLSQCDNLTGLPNRTLLSDRLRQVLLRAVRDHTQAGVMLVDLDRFKLINDTLGHTVGDQLLREVAARLQRCVRECDTISRQGGDEFAVLLPDLGSSDYAGRIAQRILDAVAQPCRLNERELELHVTCSIGISLYPRDGHSEEILLKNADIALYRAKDMGRNGYQFYLSGATMLSRQRLNLETSLRYAVEKKQMELYYQPKWDFRAGTITGAEALIRWNHPELGMLSPAKFIPIAEDSGLVLSLGEWVLRVALDEIGQMHRGAFPGLRIAVNLSVRQFSQSDLAEVVSGILEEARFDPACLELELTEGILMHHTEENMVALRRLKTIGVRIAIDDFGTGYSSLSYLQRFPVDVLKIDRSFVMELPASASSAAIVNAIVTLAHGLGLAVVAEGVETSEQMGFLQAHDCDEGQGYYIGHPLPLVEFRKLLEQDRARTAEAAAPSSERPT